MLNTLRQSVARPGLPRWLIVGLVLLGAAYLGGRPALIWLLAPLLGLGALFLLGQPRWGLFFMVGAALLLPLKFGTGTEVNLNPATLLIPALFVLWLLRQTREVRPRAVSARTTRPLLLFLLSGFLSLLIGNVLWDPAVPRSESFSLVQLAQWAVFAFAGMVFWLAGQLLSTPAALRRFTWFFLALSGGGAIAFVLLDGFLLLDRIFTIAFIRAPFWLLLTALAGGQLLFNSHLPRRWQLLCLLVLGAVVLYAFGQQAERISNWVGVVAATGVLLWLRFPRLRGLVVVVIVLLVFSGTLFPALYQFAGGDAKWIESGGSRQVLIERVVEVTMRNPLTGLGPASYRPYAGMKPLLYQKAYWLTPQINSHNNYVDLFAHTGIIGLGLFLWFMVEVLRLAIRLRQRYREGFLAGYVNAMLALWVGSMAIMLLADWLLPFVYNIGFEGFQASLLVWLFLGGLVAVDNFALADVEREATA